MKRGWAILLLVCIAGLPRMGWAEEAVQYPISGVGWHVQTRVRAQKPYVLACVVKNRTNPYMTAQLRGFEAAGKAIGFNAITFAPADRDSVEEQARFIEELIQKKVDGIAVHPADSNGIVEAVEKATAAGIPVAVIGTAANTSKILVHVGTPYYQTGAIIARWVAEKLRGKGNVVLLTGPVKAQNAHERTAGIHYILDQYPDINILAELPADFNRNLGREIMSRLIPKIGNRIDAVIGGNDESAIGAIEALEAAGLQKKGILVAGFDANEAGTRAIQEGRMQVSYNPDPLSSAWLAAAYLVMHLNDGTTPPPRYIPYPVTESIVDRGNVEAYLKENAWWKEYSK